MSTFHLTRGTDRVDTTVPAERTRLRAAGYLEHPDAATAAAAVERAAAADHARREQERDAQLARAAADAAQEGDTGGLPARSASKADWRTFALASGLDGPTAGAVTRDDLAAHYHDGDPLPAADDDGTV